MPKLIIRAPDGEFTVELKQGPNTIGRSSQCTFPVQDLSCSREHCEVRFDSSGCTVYDKGSMNGTRVNGERVREHLLKPGDKIRIGKTRIYFEKKPAQEKKSELRPQPAAKPPGPEIGVEPTRPEEDPPPAKPVTSRNVTTVPHQPVAGGVVPDYSVWERSRGRRMAKIVLAGIGVVAGLGLIVLAKSAFRSGENGGAVELGAGVPNASFEEGVDGWELSPGLQSTIAVEQEGAKHGQACLVIEKSGEPSDLVVDCINAETVDHEGIDFVEVTAWVRAEGFIGWTAFRFDSPYLGVHSEPFEVGPEWKRMKARYEVGDIPGSSRVGVTAIGRQGRIYVDDVRVVTGKMTDARGTDPWGPFRITSLDTGAFAVGTGGAPLIGNIVLALWAEKDGEMPQTVALREDFELGRDRIHVKGRLPSPLSLEEIEFEQTLVREQDGITVVYQFSEGSLSQIDHLLLRAHLPESVTVLGLSKDWSEVAQFRLRMGDRTFELEVPEITQVRLHGRMLEQRLRINPRGQTVVGFKLRGMDALGGVEELHEAVDQALRDGLPGDALDLSRRLLALTRDPGKREPLEARIEELVERERVEWRKVWSEVFLATLAPAEEAVRQAERVLVAHLRSWPGQEFDAKAVPLQEELQRAGTGSVHGPREERARDLLEQWKRSGSAGHDSLAAELLSLLQTHFSDTEAAGQSGEAED